MVSDVTTLQDERVALSDRLQIVLDSLEAKGGDIEEYEQYLRAVSGVELDTTDVGTVWAGVVGWITSKEGGQRWAWNLGKFLLILAITAFLARIFSWIVHWLLERKIHLTQLAERLISVTIKNLFMLVGFAIALTALEIDITPILAAIGATGLVVGLALQGTLSNFASGLMILINRPFDVGDVVTAGGVTGTVNKMNLVSTTFRTFDNQTIHVPNNEIWNNVITNITANPTRRVDMEFGIGYSDDFEKAETIIQEVVAGHELILDDPQPVVVTHALADSSVNIVCRPWAKTEDWWQVKTDVVREVKRRFDEAKISIPFPQQDIHVHSIDGRLLATTDD
jgi:small conductance mechanosensitive channel